jgi:ethanolamine permease
VITLNSSIAPGAFGLQASGEPLLDGFRTLFGGEIAKLLAAIAITGLAASFHAIIFAFGRQIYSLSRAGYFPRFLSVTHGRHQTPQAALLAGSLLGLGVMFFVWFVYGEKRGGAFIGAALLNMAVFGAMLSYVMQALSFVLLRVRLPDIHRPYRSPLGSAGAVVALAIALVTLYFQATDPAFRAPIAGVALYYAVAMAYFALVGRKRLVLAPEEEFAMARRKRA